MVFYFVLLYFFSFFIFYVFWCFVCFVFYLIILCVYIYFFNNKPFHLCCFCENVTNGFILIILMHNEKTSKCVINVALVLLFVLFGMM